MMGLPVGAGGAGDVITTSSVYGPQVAGDGNVQVQRRVVATPGTRPVTPEVAEVGVVTVPEPDTTDHDPLPQAKVLAAKVAVVAHTAKVWSEPAFNVLAGQGDVITTSSV